MNKKLILFLTYLKIGAFTFGGGYAMIALLENEFVVKKKWIKQEDFIDMIAIAESTPGPIAINCATYIGYLIGGFFGSFLATIAVCIPSFLIIYIISLFLDRFLSFTNVGYAFKGIQVCVIYLIFTAGVRMFKGLPKNVFNILIFSLVVFSMLFCSLFAINFSSIFYILLSGLLGVIVYLIQLIKGKRKVK